KSVAQSNTSHQRMVVSDFLLEQKFRVERIDLTYVVRQIVVNFNTPIVIDTEVPQNVTFTGVLSADDDLQTISHNICLVNDLQQDRRDANEMVIRLKPIEHQQEADTAEIE